MVSKRVVVPALAAVLILNSIFVMYQRSPDADSYSGYDKDTNHVHHDPLVPQPDNHENVTTDNSSIPIIPITCPVCNVTYIQNITVINATVPYTPRYIVLSYWSDPRDAAYSVLYRYVRSCRLRDHDVSIVILVDNIVPRQSELLARYNVTAVPVTLSSGCSRFSLYHDYLHSVQAAYDAIMIVPVDDTVFQGIIFTQVPSPGLYFIDNDSVYGTWEAVVYLSDYMAEHPQDCEFVYNTFNSTFMNGTCTWRHDSINSTILNGTLVDGSCVVHVNGTTVTVPMLHDQCIMRGITTPGHVTVPDNDTTLISDLVNATVLNFAITNMTTYNVTMPQSQCQWSGVMYNTPVLYNNSDKILLLYGRRSIALDSDGSIVSVGVVPPVVRGYNAVPRLRDMIYSMYPVVTELELPGYVASWSGYTGCYYDDVVSGWSSTDCPTE